MNFALWLQTFLAAHPVIANNFDRDQDGFSSANDCDDFNNTIRPGAVEVANDFVDQDCDGADLTEVHPNLLVWFDSFPEVVDAVANDGHVYFGSWGMMTSLHSEVDVDAWTLKVLVSENAADLYPAYTNDYPSLAPDYLQDCVLVNAGTGSVIAGPIDPDFDGLLEFHDTFFVTGIPFKIDVECDFTSLVPPLIYGFTINENVGVSIQDNWDVETDDGDEVTIDLRGMNRTNLDPNLVVHLRP